MVVAASPRDLCRRAPALVLLAAAAAAAPCSFPNNISGLQIWGLASSAAGAASPAACAAACCALGASCDTWQWCAGGQPAPDAGCGADASCWIGLAGGGQRARVPGWVSFTSTPAPPAPDAFSIDASAPPAPPAPVAGIAPTTGGPGGRQRTLSMDGASMLLDGNRVLPFAGEVHFTRVPRASWARDLAAMKAGGLDVVQVYVIWIHHEEVQGQQDWSGNRDFGAFLDAAADAGLMVAPRIGPWDHGEVRNGGFPDWVQASGVPLRSNNTAWLNLVRGWYSGLAAQMAGRYWSEGGPIISLQLDNETPDVDYLLALRALAVEVGMKPWYFVKTGWPAPNKQVDPGVLFPVSGGYFDEFWTDADNSTSGFLFGAAANTSFPTITAEAGPGMASSYHRRIAVDPTAAGAAIQTFLANGVVQLGMYMYHGGSDPIGNLSTMQEQQGLGEGGANDMPCVS
jgi:hypothetical protein